MQGELKQSEIEKFLLNNFIGRIGCHANGITYVVPVSYAYHDKTIYVHTFEGLKVSMMRKNPKVCFQADKMHGIADWESVITWGTYKEINDPAQRAEALKFLAERKLPYIASQTVKLTSEWPFSPSDFKDIEGIVFKINLNEETGRYEKIDSQFK